METMSDYVKNLIKITMINEKVNLTELSRRVGKDKSQIYRILNSDSDMTLSTMDELFQAMGVKIGLVLEYDE